MSIPKFNPRSVVLFIIMMVVALLRLLTHFTHDLGPVANFTPLGAMALFGGTYFRGNLKPFAFPLLTLFASDVVLSFTIYAPFRSGLLYGGWYWTYAAFALMTIAGKLLVKKISAGNILLAVVTTTLIHWLVSDIGGCLQQNDLQGMLGLYVQRLVTAIPSEMRFLAGTAVYSIVMFGWFELMQRRYPQLAVSNG